MDFPINVAVDTVNNEMVVANATGTPASRSPSIRECQTGDAPFLRNIHKDSHPDLTELDNPVGVAVDTVNNELVVSNFTPSVTTFPAHGRRKRCTYSHHCRSRTPG